MTLYNATPEELRHLAEQRCAGRPVMVSANGRAVLDWGLLPGGVENHLLDMLVGGCVAASERGCKLPGEIVPVKPRGKTLQELHAGQPKFVPPWRR